LAADEDLGHVVEYETREKLDQAPVGGEAANLGRSSARDPAGGGSPPALDFLVDESISRRTRRKRVKNLFSSAGFVQPPQSVVLPTESPPAGLKPLVGAEIGPQLLPLQ
jgi:hypothetical protein